MKKIVVAAATGLAITAGVATSAFAEPNERSPRAVVESRTLTADAAIRVVDAVQKAAAKGNYKVAVAIVDRSGALKILVRGDGSGPQTEESAKRKAFTAVSFAKPTLELAEAVKAPGATLKDIPGTLFLGGGIPVTSNGAPIAGIGVAGAPGGDIDQTLAQEGLKALNGQL